MSKPYPDPKLTTSYVDGLHYVWLYDGEDEVFLARHVNKKKARRAAAKQLSGIIKKLKSELGLL